jgi:acyl carrier protein
MTDKIDAKADVYQDILAQLYQGLAPFVPDGVRLDENTEIVGDLDLDSVRVMEMLLQVEDRFDISIPVNILPEVTTVGDLANQVLRLI